MNCYGVVSDTIAPFTQVYLYSFILKYFIFRHKSIKYNQYVLAFGHVKHDCTVNLFYLHCPSFLPAKRQETLRTTYSFFVASRLDSMLLFCKHIVICRRLPAGSTTRLFDLYGNLLCLRNSLCCFWNSYA